MEEGASSMVEEGLGGPASVAVSDREATINMEDGEQDDEQAVDGPRASEGASERAGDKGAQLTLMHWLK